MTPQSTDSPVETDYEIAQNAAIDPIWEITEPFGLSQADVDPYGRYKAKLTPEAIDRIQSETEPDGKLVLVTGMTPTPMGEGKTVTAVGLGQALTQRGYMASITLREPSLGPVFGIKGGAAGGGYSQVLPMEDINLHFTGDMHALTAAHNLISTLLDNHIRQDTEPRIDRKAVRWKRAIDMNDRVLRNTVIGLGETGGAVREDGFLLTAASELMAVLCLSKTLSELKDRISRIIIAYDEGKNPVTVADIGATGPATLLLRDAIKPNVVQSIEGTPAFVHGGPFANIAHGTNSVIANDVALRLSEYVITEAGFGSDLGAEKFMHIVSHQTDVTPAAVVLVASIRALRYHGQEMWPADLDALKEPDVAAVRTGLRNVDKHVENLRKFGIPVVIAINRFPNDTDEEIEMVLDHCRNDLNVSTAVSTVHEDGGAGGISLAEHVVSAASQPSELTPLYEPEASIETKIETIATEIYGADSVTYSSQAKTDIERIESLDMDTPPICLSKTFHSLSDDPSLKGVPEGWSLTVRELYYSAGAGFVVVLTGDVMTLPGLPADPAATSMDIDTDGDISGLF